MELCTTCHGGCCRRYNPHLWGSDIIRICETLKVDIHFFTTAFPVSEDKVNDVIDKIPVFIFTDCGEDQYLSLVLKVNESRFYPGTSKCIFLHEWHAELMGSEELKGVIGRCGIYNCRPVGCRAYPAVYDRQKKKAVIKDPYLILENEHKRVSDSPAYNLCERELTCEDYAPFEQDYVNSAVLSRYEREFFIKVAEKWNKNPDISDNFYNFLLKEYGDRIELINKL